MNDLKPMTLSDILYDLILQDLKEGLKFHYGVCSDCDAVITRVIFNAPATIVFWRDGLKTVVKAQNGESFDKEKGLAMAICKKLGGNRGAYYDIFKKWCHEEAAVEESAQG